MPWFTVHTKADNTFLEVYDSNGVEGDPGYRGTDARFWNYTHTDEYCNHVEIANKPGEDYIWEDSQSKWKIDLPMIKDRAKSKLEAEARERFFAASAEKLLLDAALTKVSAAKNKSEIEAIIL